MLFPDAGSDHSLNPPSRSGTLPFQRDYPIVPNGTPRVPFGAANGVCVYYYSTYYKDVRVCVGGKVEDMCYER
jgi:hypothetical protein